MDVIFITARKAISSFQKSMISIRFRKSVSSFETILFRGLYACMLELKVLVSVVVSELLLWLDSLEVLKAVPGEFFIFPFIASLEL